MASLGYANARPRLKIGAVPDIPLDILNPGKSVKRLGYEKRQKAEVLNTLLTDSSGAAEQSLKHNSTDTHEHISEAESTFESVTEIWSSQPEKQKGIHVQCQSNFKSILKFRNRRVQARPDVKSKGTKAVTHVSDVGIQCSLVKLPPLHTILSKDKTEDEDTDSCSDLDEPGNKDSDRPSYTDQDPDYVPESEVHDVEAMESDPDEQVQPLGSIKPIDERYFLVSESKLFQLLKICQHCKSVCIVQVKSVLGTMITVNSICSHGHTSTWHSQNMCHKMPLGNLLLSNAILVSGNSAARIISLFCALNCPIFCHRTYDNLQTNYLIPSVYRLWDLHQADNITAAQGSMLILGGDGRCDSPGHSAKYCSYTAIDLDTNIILDLQLVQSNEVKTSFHMELEGLKRCLHNLEEFGLTVDTLVTDRHVQVKKFMKEEHKDKNHYFDVWHLAKGVSKKLEMAAKKKTFRDIRPWIKSIVNHIYWVASSSTSNGQLKRAKWLSIINHVSDIHEGHSLEFPKCEYGPLHARQWIKKGSRAYKKLREIVESPYLLRDIEKLSPCHQTYGLEVFHTVVTHYAPKSTLFFFPAMHARLFIAALHYNENCSKRQARSSTGQLRWKVCYPKSKKGQEAVVKPCKEESTYDYIQELKEAVVTRRASLPNYEQAFKEAQKRLGDVPENLTENYVKVDKESLVEEHKSRFPFKPM